MMADRRFLFSILVFYITDVCSLSLSNDGGFASRRDVLIGGGSVGIAAAGLLNTNDQGASAASSSSDLPIAVLGASGRTGALCVMACLERGLPVRALTRSGSWLPPPSAEAEDDSNNNVILSGNPLLTVAPCDLKDTTAIQNGVRGCRGVIYAASASKKGGNAKEIDNIGVIEAGKACLQANVGRYVVVSSTATTRPKSLGYIFTNVLGGIMAEKRQGEEGVQALYAADKTPPSYTIIRPGGLEEPKKNEVLGPTSLEISQGDTLAGIISRADLAEVAVELAASNASNFRDTAIELYYTDSAQPCERRFKSLLADGIRLHGETYQELFSGIQPNIDFFGP
jgi:uncharacterized protein YbjT (DUF2867 family)